MMIVNANKTISGGVINFDLFFSLRMYLLPQLELPLKVIIIVIIVCLFDDCLKKHINLDVTQSRLIT